MAKSISDSNFHKEVINAENPVFVDFWASWCGPCKMLAPVIDEISKEYGDKVKFVKVNVDENPESANKYGIASIPTVMVFKEGSVVETLVGFRPKAALEQVVKKYL